ncbi:uroporphyrinogen decarboxylase [Pseudomonadales bacterium]|nr:uroporphyrinogen decarboxylase [Pseudomonadales bacterium]
MFPALKNDTFLRALLRQPVDYTPVWMMRQAGRYLPEYRATRSKAGDFLSLCKNTELACEVTLQPLARYPLDAAILFSDILTIPDAMGLGLYFEEGEGPKFERPITSAAEIDNLSVDVLTDLQYVMDAVTMIRRELNGSVPLIGFTGSPWTLATYMVEGGSTREFKKIKTLLYKDPAALHLLLDKLATVVAAYLNAQIEAGAQAVQIFDTWGGVLSDSAYLEFSLGYIEKIISQLNVQREDGTVVPVIAFTKGGAPWLDAMSRCGCHAVGLDWSANIGQVRSQIGDRVALQGNMDPAILRAPIASIEAEVQRILASFGQHSKGSGHVFNLGHGITPDIDPEHAGAFIAAVKEYSPQYHR